MRKNPQKSSPRRNLALAMLESVLTSALISVPFMSLFWGNTIGLSFGEIGLSQAIFSIVMIVLDYPMGILADKLGRKRCNVIGDFGMALGHLYYATTNSFGEIVIAECLLAIFGSLSNGVDASLIRHFSGQIDDSGKLFKTKFAKLSVWQNAFSLATVIIGAPIGAISYRAVIAFSAVPYLIAGIISLFIVDDSEKMPAGSPLKDVVRVAKKCLSDRKMRLAIAARIFSRESTHVMLWLTTPIMLMAGLPSEIVVLPWLLNSLLAVVGSWFGKKYIKRFADWQFMTILTVLIAISTLSLSIVVNIWTAPLFLLMGVAQGLTGATLRRLPEQYAEKSEQTSVSSFAATLGRIVYAVLSSIVSYAADVSYSLSAFATFIMFIPICIFLTIKLKREA